jgi:hypothetical protein
MKRRAASRKVNYASIVKINMPALVGGCDFSEAAYRHFKSMTTQSRFNKLLDNGLVWIIIVFTVTAPACTWVADAGEGFQTRTLAGTGNFKPAAPRGHRPTVCQGHLFRSQRSRPGKVRDASPRAERGPFDHWRGDRFRFLAALVLSSAVCFRGGRARRLGSPQTRSQAGAQADRRGLGLHRRDTPEGAVDTVTGTGALDPRAFWDQGASTKHPTQPAASSKKTPLKESRDQQSAHSDLTVQYEQLRREATSRSGHAAQGLGLALFLRRGMTAWMQAWSQCTDCAAPNAHPRPATAAAVPMDLRTQIATVLAGIILGLQQEATP